MQEILKILIFLHHPAGAAAPAAAAATGAAAVTSHFSSSCLESSAASTTVNFDKSSIILFKSDILNPMNYFFKLFARAKLAIFEPGASKILTNFWAGDAKIPTIFALASSKVGSVAIIATSFWSKTLPSMNPATIFSFLFDFANFVKILAEVIGSEDNAAAVGPVKYFSKSLQVRIFYSNFVILFFVILK